MYIAEVTFVLFRSPNSYIRGLHRRRTVSIFVRIFDGAGLHTTPLARAEFSDTPSPPSIAVIDPSCDRTWEYFFCVRVFSPLNTGDKLIIQVFDYGTIIRLL